MAEKFSVLIKYKYLDYIENAKLSDADAWVFVKSLIDYDRTGRDPVYKNPVLTGLFAVAKIDIDQNRENYDAVSEERRKSGKKGAEKRWGGKDSGDENAASGDSKNSNCHTGMAKIAIDSKCQKKRKNEKNMAKMHDLDSDSEFDSEEEFFYKKNEKNTNNSDEPKEQAGSTAEGKYPKLDWQALYREIIAAGFPDPGGEVRFCTGAHVYMPYFAHLSPPQILGAIRNYGKTRNMPGTWWNVNPTFRTWCSKHLELFLPENFEPEKFRAREGPQRKSKSITEELFGDAQRVL